MTSRKKKNVLTSRLKIHHWESQVKELIFGFPDIPSVSPKIQALKFLSCISTSFLQTEQVFHSAQMLSRPWSPSPTEELHSHIYVEKHLSLAMIIFILTLKSFNDIST